MKKKKHKHATTEAMRERASLSESLENRLSEEKVRGFVLKRGSVPSSSCLGATQL